MKPNGAVDWSSYNIRSRAVINKMALVFSTQTDFSYCFPLSSLRCNKTFHYLPLKERERREATSLYVYPEVRISRDLIRRSGYKIVLNPEKADYCILPAFRNAFRDFRYDIMAYNEAGDVLHLFTVTNYKDEIDDAAFFSRAKDALLRVGLKVIGDKLLKNSMCYIIPKADAFIDALCPSPDMADRKYISESQLPLDYMNTITVENLLLWEKLADSDSKLFEQVITAANWRDYPVTMCMFFSLVCPFGRLFYSANGSTKFMLETIGYSRNDNIEKMCKDKIVQPEDWNMMQDYIMAKFEVEQKGGFTDSKCYSTSDRLLDFTRSKLCIAPLHIDSPMLFENIIACL